MHGVTMKMILCIILIFHLNTWLAEDCKMTLQGTEYMGTLSSSASGWKCQNWDTVTENKKLFTTILDSSFGSGSRKHARNYCRNPTNTLSGPWCFTLNALQEVQMCNVPFCNFAECRHTGYGEEYQGKAHVSSSLNQCLPWSGAEVTQFNLEGKMTCANPTADPAGPWCWVMTESGEQKELCDVPICDFPVFGRVVQSSEYSMFTEIKNNSLTFSTRLWNPDIKPNVTRGSRVFLSSLNSPHGHGFEIELGMANFGGGLSLRRWPLPKSPIEYEDVVSWKPKRPPFSLSSSGISWSKFWVTWDNGDIQAGEVGVEDVPRVSLQIHKENIRAYSLAGPAAIWQSKDACEVHVTSSMDFSQMWPLVRTEMGHQLDFSVRSFHSAVIQLYHGPHVSHAVVQLVLQENNKNYVYLVSNNTRTEQLAHNYENKIFVDPFEWMHFAISLFGDILQLTWKKSPTNSVTLLEGKHTKILGVRWFSIGSQDSLTYWTLTCRPPENDTMVEAIPPECSTSTIGSGYLGHQSAAASGRPCLPWSHLDVPEDFKKDNLYPDGSVDAAMNYCRNPNNNENGTWCFTSATKREECSIRRCRFENCRMAGTGNDYMGSLSTTISGRKCQAWLDTYPHEIPERDLNITRFPERDLLKASNFCRNPNRNATGSWCYTTDPNLPFDVCAVKNCEKQEECTMLTVQSPPSSNVYILPKWKSEGLKFWLKEWDPERPDGIKFVIKPISGDNESYVLLVGAQENQAIELYYEKNGKQELKKEKKSPHIIPIGKWGGFWLRMEVGIVELGVEDIPDPIFKWKDRSNSRIDPALLNFGSIYQNLIGIHFPCDGQECHTQHFEQGNMYAKYELQENVYPITMWKPNSNESALTGRTFEIYARGDGRLRIQFFQFPGHKEFFNVMIGRMLYFTYYNYIYGDRETLFSDEYDYFLITKTAWRKFNFWFNETDMSLSFPLNNGTMKHYNYTSQSPNQKFLFYYYIIRTGGAIDWSANCKPADLDGAPRDGGWSAWSAWNCSVPCGGGEGFRKRSCTNPEPNVFGKYCVGKDIMYGRCNTSPCGQASPDTLQEVQAYLNSNHFSYLLQDGDTFSHTCKNPVLSTLKEELKKVQMVWTKNGIQLDHPTSNSTKIVVMSVNSSSPGVYALVMMNKESGSHTTLCVATLSVLVSMQPREGDTVQLHSNALALGYFYPNLKLRWVLGTQTWKSFGISPLAALQVFELQGINAANYSGYWSCVVTQVEQDFSWTTAWYYITVLPKKGIAEHLVEDPVLSKVFGPVQKFAGTYLVIPAAILLMIILCSLLCIAVILFRSWQRMQL